MPTHQQMTDEHAVDCERDGSNRHALGLHGGIRRSVFDDGDSERCKGNGRRGAKQARRSF